MSVSGGDRTSGTGSERRETSSGEGERLDSLEGGSDEHAGTGFREQILFKRPQRLA